MNTITNFEAYYSIFKPSVINPCGNLNINILALSLISLITNTNTIFFFCSETKR